MRDQVDHRALGKIERLLEVVRVLPVEVPVVDLDQVLNVAVGEFDGHLHVAAQQMHVRRDRVGDHVDGDLPGGLDLDVRLTGGSSRSRFNAAFQCRVCLTGLRANCSPIACDRSRPCRRDDSEPG